jgi:hypothetical protein
MYIEQHNIMNMNQKEQIIFEKALAKLKRITGWDRIDNLGGINELDFQLGDIRLEFTFVIKNDFRTGHIGLLMQQFMGNRGAPLLITRYINPIVGEKLKDLKINYIDTAGNICIIIPPVFIYLTGKKPDEEVHAKKYLGTFQAAAGLQIVFALLCNRDLVKKTVRELADLTGFATGTIHNVFNDLARRGYIIKHEKTGKKLVNRRTLLNKWIEAYPENLRPKIIYGKYKLLQIDKTGNDLEEYGALWGGETAAALMTNYLTPKIQTIFIGDEVKKYIFRKRLELDPKGELELMEIFWKFKWPEEELHVVPPILVYADLMATDNERNIETAKLIYERYLARYIEED